MSHDDEIEKVRAAASRRDFADHVLRLAAASAQRKDVPIASIADAAGVTRQTIYNWAKDYTPPPVGELPTQRPRAAKGAPVLILSGGIRKGRWEGCTAKAIKPVGDMLAVAIPGKLVDVIIESWALIGDSTGKGRRPAPNDLVLCLPDGGLGYVSEEPGPDGAINIHVSTGMRSCRQWAIILQDDDGVIIPA